MRVSLLGGGRTAACRRYTQQRAMLPPGIAIHLLWLPAFLSGYAAAVIVNIGVFTACDRELCLAGSHLAWTPGVLGIVVSCWLIRHRNSTVTAAAAGAGLAVMLWLSTAPLRARNPLSWSMNTFPAEFLISGLVQLPASAVSLIFAPGYLLFLIAPAVGGAVLASVIRPRRPHARRFPTATVALFLGAAIGAEIVTTPTTWSLLVHRRIMAVELIGPPGVASTAHRAWGRRELHFTIPPPTNTQVVFEFYDRLFAGWRRIERSSEDTIWLDRTGTVLAWGRFGPESPDGNRYATVSLTDRDRAAWYHRFRRTSNGERVVDLLTASR